MNKQDAVVKFAENFSMELEDAEMLLNYAIKDLGMTVPQANAAQDVMAVESVAHELALKMKNRKDQFKNDDMAFAFYVATDVVDLLKGLGLMQK